jgi:hypothetical protein
MIGLQFSRNHPPYALPSQFGVSSQQAKDAVKRSPSAEAQGFPIHAALNPDSDILDASRLGHRRAS